MKTNRTQNLLAAALVSALALATTGARAQDASPAEARAIAKEAYIYGFPVVDSYRIQYAYFVDAKNREFKAPWNQLFSMARLVTPEDKAVQSKGSN